MRAGRTALRGYQDRLAGWRGPGCCGGEAEQEGVVSCSAVEFPDGLGDGEACGRNADEGGPYGLAGQFGDAARVVVFLEVGEGCGLGDRDGVGLAGLPGGDLVAAPAAGEAVDHDGVEVPGLVPESGVDGQRPACSGGEAPGGEVVDAEEGDVAFARGGAEVAAGAPFDEPGGEPGVFQGGGCQAGLADCNASETRLSGLTW